MLAAGLPWGLAAAPLAGMAPPVVTCIDNDVRIEVRSERTPATPREVHRQALVESIAEACGLRLVRHRDLAGTVQLTGQVLTLPEILDALLADESYQLLVSAGADAAKRQRGALWIFADGDAIPAEAQLLFETVLMQGAFAERRDAVRQLRRLANADAARLLSFALTDPDERVRDAASEALSIIGGDEALAVLASVGVTGDPAARAGAAEAIALAGSDSALDYLAAAMADPDPRVRAAAVQSIAELDGHDARPFVRRALADPDETVRQQALETLEDMDDDAMFHALFPPE